MCSVKMKAILFGSDWMLNDIFENHAILCYLDIVGIVHIDSAKWGQAFGNYQILPLDALETTDYDKIIISSINFAEISQFLTETLHVPKRKVTLVKHLIVPELHNMGRIKIKDNTQLCYDLLDLMADKRIVPDNDLEQFFFYEEHRVIHKWWHFFEIYDQFFHRYKNKPVKMLEIGIDKGGSLQMWKNYFGKNALIVGIDVTPECKEFEEEQIEICIGSQNDPQFLRSVSEQYGDFDIVLDDGSHFMHHQVTSFECLFPRVKDGGLYVCEDVHTSYMPSYNGCLYGKSTFIEYSKNWIDGLHEQYVDKEYKKLIAGYTPEIRACHFYDSIIVLEKSRKKAAIAHMLGKREETATKSAEQNAMAPINL